MDQFEPNIPSVHGIDAEGKEYELDLTSPFDAPSSGGESGIGIAPSYPGLPDEFLSPAERERRSKAEFQRFRNERALTREIEQDIPTEDTKRFIATKKRLKEHKATRAQLEQSAQRAARARTSATRQAAVDALSRIIPSSSRTSTREQERQAAVARRWLPYTPPVYTPRSRRSARRLPRWATRMATPLGVIVGGSLLFVLTVLGDRTRAQHRAKRTEREIQRQNLQHASEIADYNAPPLPPSIHNPGSTIRRPAQPPLPKWYSVLIALSGSTPEEIQALAMSRGRRRREYQERQQQERERQIQIQTQTPQTRAYQQKPAYVYAPPPPPRPPVSVRPQVQAVENSNDFSDLPETWVEAQRNGYGWEEWREACQERSRARKRATDRARRARQRAERDAMMYW